MVIQTRKQKRKLAKEIKKRGNAYRRAAFKEFKEMTPEEQEAYLTKANHTKPTTDSVTSKVFKKLVSFLR